MKSTGIVRKVDELGRVVIPIELRNQFQIYKLYSEEEFLKDSPCFEQQSYEDIMHSFGIPLRYLYP